MKKSGYLVLVLWLALSIVMAACTDNENSNNSSNSGGSNDSSNSSNISQNGNGNEQAEAGISFPLDEPVELRFFTPKHNNTAKHYSEFTMFQELEERTNVTIDWDIVSRDQTDEQFNLMLASGDLPDAFVGNRTLDVPKLLRLIEDDLLIPLDDLIDQHAPNVKAFFEKHPDVKATFTAADGNLYSIPGGAMGSLNLISEILFINKNWLDQIDRDVPTTTEEFYEVLKLFSEQDMNGNGENDEIPFSFIYDDGTTQPSMISGAFNTMDNVDKWYVKDEEVRFSPADEGFKDYAAYMHRLANEGLMDIEVFSHNRSAYYAKVRQQPELVGAFISQSLGQSIGREDSGYVAVPALEGPEGHKQVNQGQPDLRPTGMAITVENEHPEITLKWLDLIFGDEEMLVSLNRGPKGRNWNYTDDNKIEYTAPPEGMVNSEWRHSEAPGAFSFVMIPEEIADREIFGPAQTERLSYHDIFLPDMLERYVPPFMMSDEDAEIYNQIMVDLEEYSIERFASWVFQGGVEEQWDSYLAQLEQLGLNEVEEIMNRYFDEYLANQ